MTDKNGNSAANLGFEDKLWKAADALRSNMDAAEYKHVVLGLIFLKYISDAIQRSEIAVEYLDAPHCPPTRLPSGRMAVYGFWGDGAWLKIGKVGPKSNARYTSQHYNAGSAQSTLAGSVINDPHMRSVPGFDARAPGEWIKSSTDRINILLPSTREIELLSLLEAFLHLRFRPRHEG